MGGLIGGIVVAIAATALAVPASASDADLVIPIDTLIVAGVAAGDAVELTTVSSGPLEGRTCDARAIRRQGGPVHAGNDLVVRSGTARLLLADVERDPDATTAGAEPIELGGTVTVELAMGPTELFAGDVVVELECRRGSEVAALAAPTGERGQPILPIAGGDIALIVVAAAASVAAGAVIVATVRRRRAPTRTVG